MAADRNRVEGTHISAVQMADGRIEYLPEEGYPPSGESADILTVLGKSKSDAGLDFIDVSDCYIVGDMV